MKPVSYTHLHYALLYLQSLVEFNHRYATINLNDNRMDAPAELTKCISENGKICFLFPTLMLVYDSMSEDKTNLNEYYIIKNTL